MRTAMKSWAMIGFAGACVAPALACARAHPNENRTWKRNWSRTPTREAKQIMNTEYAELSKLLGELGLAK